MGRRKASYSKRKRSSIAKDMTKCRIKSLMVRINGKMEDLVHRYITFFKSLDQKIDFCTYANKIIPKSAQWNAIRKKHLTASQIKRVYQWNMNTKHIYKNLFQYVSDKFMTRGDIIEDKVVDILRASGYTINYRNHIWIHKGIPWLSCTTDGIIECEKSIDAAIEIKSYTSFKRFNKAIKINDGVPSLRQKSSEYAQIQVIAEILNVTMVLLIVEYNLHLYKIIVVRDQDFLYRIFDRIKQVYLQYIVPHNIFGPPCKKTNKSTEFNGYFNDSTYRKLHRILELVHDDMIESSDAHILHYYGNVLPSHANNSFFEQFHNHKLEQKMRNERLICNSIMYVDSIKVRRNNDINQQ